MTTTPILFDAHDWEPLVETLRSELQEYGGLFNLLARQQDRIIERRPDDVLAINDEIENQTHAVAELRLRREELVDALTRRAGLKAPGTLRGLVPCFPEVVRPLVEALITDINHRVRRNRQKARQNHLLLSRAMELTEQTLRVLQPENFTRTYQRTGKVSLTGRPAAARYQAVG
jgi:flagellar biosynthesis/type III secretory pathway chaperone